VRWIGYEDYCLRPATVFFNLGACQGFTTLPMPTQTVKMQGKTLKLTTPYSDKNILKVISATGSNFEVKKQGNVLLVQSVEVTTNVNYVLHSPKSHSTAIQHGSSR